MKGKKCLLSILCAVLLLLFSATILYAMPDVNNSSVTVNKKAARPNGMDEVVFTIKVLDENKKPVANQKVYFASRRGDFDNFTIGNMKYEDFKDDYKAKNYPGSKNVYFVTTDKQGKAEVKLRSKVAGRTDVGFALRDSIRGDIYSYLTNPKATKEDAETIALIDIIRINFTDDSSELKAGIVDQEKQKETSKEVESPLPEEMLATDYDFALNDTLARTGTAKITLKNFYTVHNVTLSSAVLDELRQMELPLIIEYDAVKFTIPIENITTNIVTENGDKVELTLTKEAKDSINKLFSPEKKDLTDIGLPYYSLDIKGIKEFSRPVSVTFSLSSADLNKHNPQNFTGVSFISKVGAIKQGGSYDKNAVTFTFQTNQSGTYGIFTSTNPGQHIQLVINKNTAVINGKNTYLDVPATLLNNRTMVPLRFITESFGADVQWLGEENAVKITLDGLELQMKIGEKLPGFDTPATIVNGRTLVPIRYISEYFGAYVLYLPETSTIEIYR